MTNGSIGTGGSRDGGAHWPATVASLAVGAAFFALWFWLLPSWLGFHVDTMDAARWRWIAAVPSVLDGRDTGRRRQLLRRRGWLWWGSIDT